jgi:hypothetical protein
VYVDNYGAVWAEIVMKNYHGDDTWSNPYGTGFQFNDALNGSFQSVVDASGGARGITINAVSDRVPLGKWTHLAMTYDSSSGYQTVYKNGILVGSTTGSAVAADWGTHGRWFAGGLYMGGDYFVGRIDEVYVDTAAWSAAKVGAVAWSSAHYNPGS